MCNSAGSILRLCRPLIQPQRALHSIFVIRQFFWFSRSSLRVPHSIHNSSEILSSIIETYDTPKIFHLSADRLESMKRCGSTWHRCGLWCPLICNGRFQSHTGTLHIRKPFPRANPINFPRRHSRSKERSWTVTATFLDTALDHLALSSVDVACSMPPPN